MSFLVWMLQTGFLTIKPCLQPSAFLIKVAFVEAGPGIWGSLVVKVYVCGGKREEREPEGL